MIFHVAWAYIQMSGSSSSRSSSRGSKGQARRAAAAGGPTAIKLTGVCNSLLLNRIEYFLRFALAYKRSD
jgi:hypothetical protein